MVIIMILVLITCTPIVLVICDFRNFLSLDGTSSALVGFCPMYVEVSCHNE